MTPHTDHAQAQQRGFTLIELLLVVAIVSVLVALLSPALSLARDRARDIRCSANIRQGNVAFQAYFLDFKLFMPPLGTPWGYNYGSWYNPVRPYAGMTGPAPSSYPGTDKPVALACTDGGNTTAPAFPFFRYSTVWSMRFKTTNDGATSNRIDSFNDPALTGLIFDAGALADTLSYPIITSALRGDDYSGTFNSYRITPLHGSRGASASFLDGHAGFYSVMPAWIQMNDAVGHVRWGSYPNSIPWARRSFWGKVNGVYLASNYQYNY
jgi:prepilin-type N-terminal cleavage/methylation domain-containing protein